MSSDPYRHKWIALIGVSFLAFTAFLDFTIVNTALPFIQKDLNADVLQLQWVQNIFVIILSMTMIAVGKFGDLWGRKKIFYTGVFIFGAAAMGAALSQSIHSLTFFRALQGFGASILFILAASLLSDAFPKDEQPKAVGIYSGITGLGLTIGPFLSGLLISTLSWRWVFWINVPLIAIGFIFCLVSLRKVVPPLNRVKIDWISLFLLIVGLGTLVYGIIALDWLMIVGLITLTLLFILDMKKKDPLLSLRTIFQDRVITLSLLSCCVAGTVCTVFLFFDPLYLDNIRKLSPLTIGLLIAVIPVAQVVVSFLFDRLLKWVGMTGLLLISILAGALGIALHWFIGETTPILLLLIPFFFLGLPWGLSNTCFVTAVNQRVTAHKIGETIGTIATIWNIAGAVLLSVSSVVFHHASNAFIPQFHAMVTANFAFVAIILLAALYLTKKLKNQKV